MKGKGKLILTGKLGEVMQESARAAVSYLRSRADYLGIDPDFNETSGHAHPRARGRHPQGRSVRRHHHGDRPGFGAHRIPVRKDVAMTGEITLRGKVLPVGGIKDKALAAFRAGITEMILPKENEKDLDEVPAEVRGRWKSTSSSRWTRSCAWRSTAKCRRCRRRDRRLSVRRSPPRQRRSRDRLRHWHIDT